MCSNIAIFCVDSDCNLLAVFLNHFDRKFGIGNRDTADNDAIHSIFKVMKNIVFCADPAADLNVCASQLGSGLDNKAVINPLSILGAVQVNHMNPFSTVSRKGLCHIKRGIPVDRFFVVISLEKADTFSAAHVNCRINGETHRTAFLSAANFKKLSRSAIPSLLLFSGWNCMPNIFPRPTTAATCSW